MAKNETGEFELVLGNQQLLIGFAVVLILFGVFFAMGYIVGRNSTPSPRMAAEMQAPPSSQPEPVRPQNAAPAPAPEGRAEDSAQKPAGAPPAADAAPATQPARAPEAAKPVEKTPEPSAAVQTVENVQPGTYLQVMAIKKQDADVIAKALQGKGFPTLMTPSSREGIFRVMVGPYKDATSLGNAKTELENSGFHPIVQKIADRT
jgi:cell division septation protein DedD